MEYGSASSIPHIEERDVDLVLLQLIQTSPRFRRWIVQQLAPAITPDRLLWSQKSAGSDLGETDIAFAVEATDGDTHVILIEDKIDAEKQPRQAARYFERGEGYVEERRCDAFHVCLVAPAAYITEEDRDEFKNTLDYETLLDAIEPLAHDGVPTIVEVLQAGIDKDRKGSVPVVSEVDNRLKEVRQQLPALVPRDPSETQIKIESANPDHPDSVVYKLFAPKKFKGEKTDVRIDLLEDDPDEKERIQTTLEGSVAELNRLTGEDEDFEFFPRTESVVIAELRRRELESRDEFHDRVADRFIDMIGVYHPQLIDHSSKK